MALDKSTLKAQLIAAFTQHSIHSNVEKVAQDIADAVDVFVKSGEVEVDEGINVNTTGTATAQSGKTVTKGKGRVK